MSYPIEPYNASSDAYQNETSCLTQTILKEATLGAMVGATATAAAQLRKTDNKLRSETAVKKIIKAGITSGIATAAASAVGNTVGTKNSLPTLAAMFVTGTAMMYFLNSKTSKGEK